MLQGFAPPGEPSRGSQGISGGEVVRGGERMTPAPLSMKGRNAGVYGFLDGNRGYSGGVWSGGDDSTSESRDLHLRCAQREGLECCARVTALRLPLRVYP